VGVSVSTALSGESLMSTSVVSTRTYVATFASLMVLLVLTIAIAYIPLGRFNWVSAMTISAAKTAVITIFFKHLRSSHRLVWVAACAGCFWLALLMILSLTDFWTRGWLQH
jgi:cytochrome c oxidase subunit IV